MKKIILYIILFVLISFTIPILFSSKFKTIDVYSEEKKISEEVELDLSYEYSDYNTVKLLYSDTNDIEEVNLEEYLCNVVSAEIPANFEEEAIKAQAIVARTYTIYTIIKNGEKHGEADICDSSKCCQAWISKEERMNKWSEENKIEYWNKIVTSVNETKGKVILYNKEIINAVYHANSGGITEIASMVWGGNDYPYLQSVETSR
jgi:stage II sporulation protein D